MSDNVLSMDPLYAGVGSVEDMTILQLADGTRRGDSDCTKRLYDVLHDDLLAIAKKTIHSAMQAEFIVRKSYSEVLRDREGIDPFLFELNLIQVVVENTRKMDINNTYTDMVKLSDVQRASLIEQVKAKAVEAKTVEQEGSLSLTALAAEGPSLAMPDYADAAGEAVSEREAGVSRTISIPVILGSAAALAAAGIGTTLYQQEQVKKRDLSYTQMMNDLQLGFATGADGKEIREFEYAPNQSMSTRDLVASHTGTLHTSIDAVDMSRVGSVLVNYSLTDTDGYGQTAMSTTTRSYVVKDTQMPAVNMTTEAVTLTAGDAFDPQSVISSVFDPADGDLPRVDAEPAVLVNDAYGRTYETGWYTLTSNVDVNKAGSYTVAVHAVDNHGNAVDANVPVTVNPKPVVQQTFGGGAPVAVNTSDNAAYIYNFLTQAGFSKAATAGIMANIQIESRFNPTAGSAYYGLCQWGGGRASNLVAYCAANGMSSDSVEGQIRFMMSEMSGSLIAEMNACPDSAEGAAQAGYIFRTKFERSAGLDNVQAIASSFYNAY